MEVHTSGAQDSGVETECDIESNDSTLSSVSVGITNNNPLQPVDDLGGASGSNNGASSSSPMDPQPSTSTGLTATNNSSEFSIPSNPVPSSASSSLSVTPEPSTSNAISTTNNCLLLPPSIGNNSFVPPPSVTEDGYLGDCSSDGGNEKNFPMPAEKLKRLLCDQKQTMESDNNSDNNSIDPPAGLSFQNLQDYAGYGYQISPYRGSSSNRKMRSSVIKSNRVHNHNANSTPWSQMKSNIAGRKLRLAANMNNVDSLERLLSSGTNANSTDEHNRTALHFAAAKGYTEATRILLGNGADPNQKDALGNTALHLAACTNHVGVVTLLLRSGTNVAELDNNGRTPLQLAQSKLKLLQKNRTGAREMTTVSTVKHCWKLCTK